MKLKFKRIDEIHDSAVARAWSVIEDLRLRGVAIEWSEAATVVRGVFFTTVAGGDGVTLTTEQAQMVSKFVTQRLKHGLALDGVGLEV